MLLDNGKGRGWEFLERGEVFFPFRGSGGGLVGKADTRQNETPPSSSQDATFLIHKQIARWSSSLPSFVDVPYRSHHQHPAQRPFKLESLLFPMVGRTFQNPAVGLSTYLLSTSLKSPPLTTVHISNFVRITTCMLLTLLLLLSFIIINSLLLFAKVPTMQVSVALPPCPPAL